MDNSSPDRLSYTYYMDRLSNDTYEVRTSSKRQTKRISQI